MNNANHSLPQGGGLGRGATTPYYLIDADAVRHNLEILRGVMDRTGAHILLAQKAFSCYALYPMIGEYLSGATASGLFEARLCHEEMQSNGKWKKENQEYRVPENHIYSPAFREEDIDEIVTICDHIVFNSIRQFELYGKKAKDHGCQIGLRINPECSTQPSEHSIYDPCASGSRLGVTAAAFRDWIDKTNRKSSNDDGESDILHSPSSILHLIDGLHFHTLCEQNSDALKTTLDAVIDKFGKWLPQMKWINFGGGHHITRKDYDIDTLEQCICRMQNDYGLDVYLEPGEAVALNAGTLHATVLEVQPKGKDGISNVILDTSAACHMPDVLEMPYTPPLLKPRRLDEDFTNENVEHKGYMYRFGGPTCLSGDVIGIYNACHQLHEGDEVIFGDMAIYSMVKNNTFNGMPLPSIYIKEGEETRQWKSFSYDDFKSRL